MPYGDLVRQAVQRFAVAGRPRPRPPARSRSARSTSRTSRSGTSSTPASTTARILAGVEPEADVILWDGGNNDFRFYRPDLHIVLVDPLRAGPRDALPPGRGRAADGRRRRRRQDELPPPPADVERVAASAAGARTARGDRARRLAGPARRSRPVSRAGASSSSRTGRRSPTAAWPTARATSPPGAAGAAAIVDPRPFARGRMRAVFAALSAHRRRCCRRWAIRRRSSPRCGRRSRRRAADVVVAGTPLDLARAARLAQAGRARALRVRGGRVPGPRRARPRVPRAEGTAGATPSVMPRPDRPEARATAGALSRAREAASRGRDNPRRRLRRPIRGDRDDLRSLFRARRLEDRELVVEHRGIRLGRVAAARPARLDARAQARRPAPRRRRSGARIRAASPARETARVPAGSGRPHRRSPNPAREHRLRELLEARVRAPAHLGIVEPLAEGAARPRIRREPRHPLAFDVRANADRLEVLDETARDRRLARAGEAAGDDESRRASPRERRGELDVFLDLPRESIRSARLEARLPSAQRATFARTSARWTAKKRSPATPS